MNKNKIILSAIGGVALVAVLVSGYLIYSGLDEQSMKVDDLEGAQGNVSRINAAKVAPTDASVRAIVSNRVALATWLDETLALASAGDFRVDAGMTPEGLKQLMVDEARELAKLPAGGVGPLVKEDFGFGFNDIIAGGAIPPREKVALMQRQWREVKLFTEVLSKSGAVELTGVTVVEAAAPAPEQETKPKNGRGRKRVAEEKADPVTQQAYELKFLARPAALVRVLNAFAVNDRFITVDGCDFARETDTLMDIIDVSKDKEVKSLRNRAARRRRPNKPEAVSDEGSAEEEANKKGLVTDPAMDLPFIVTLKLTTFDFGNAADPSAAAAEDETADDDADVSKEEEE